MGGGSSKNLSDSLACGRDKESSNAGTLLFVTLRLHNVDGQQLPAKLSPHVYGSSSMFGSWNFAKAIAMEPESTSTWELSFVMASYDGNLEFKFLLKPSGSAETGIVEEGPSRLLNEGVLDGNTRAIAKLWMLEGGDKFEFPVSIRVDQVSAFALAASWRAYKGNFQSHGSFVQGIPDGSVDSSSKLEQSSSQALELDLEQYEVPPPTSATNPGVQYAADATENPRQLHRSPTVPDAKSIAIQSQKTRRPDGIILKERSVSIKDLVVLGSESPQARSISHPNNTLDQSVTAAGEMKCIGTDLVPPQHREDQGCYVDRGVGSSPKLAALASDVSILDGNEHLDAKTQDMPEAAGAVTAAAIADRMLVPKERRQLAIVLVGLPARGKTFTAAKLTRYLRWLGHDTKHFNVGKYRRLKHGCSQTADFFRSDNQEGVDARNEVAILAMEDMLAWMQEGGQVGVFDATNSTKERRNMLVRTAEGKCKVIFLESICNDQAVIDRNIRLKIQESPDYADVSNYEEASIDFKARLANYEKFYEPVDEGSYIKIIDRVSGEGGQLQVNNISGYLPGRIVFFLVNTHITPRPILLTRHGESLYNVRGRIGGDPVLSEYGESYAKKLADFVNKRLKMEQTASIWTSTLQRTIQTARHISGFPKVQWRALDEINAGECDGMTYEEIKVNMPEEYDARKLDKLRYRYPRGESYLDVIQRLEPVIIELERQRSSVVVVAHQAVLRSLYAYFADKPPKEIPYIEVPLHTIIEIQMGVSGVQEKRYKLM